MANLIGFLAVVSAKNLLGHQGNANGRLCTVETCQAGLENAQSQERLENAQSQKKMIFKDALVDEKLFFERVRGPHKVWEYCPLKCAGNHKKPQLFRCSVLKNLPQNMMRRPICPWANNHAYIFTYVPSYIYMCISTNVLSLENIHFI